MAILDNLAAHIADETSMQVDEAVLLLSSADGLPRARLAKRSLSRHALLSAPAGLFFCDLDFSRDKDFLAELAAKNVEVGDLTRLNPKEEIVIEGNWPARKVQISGTYYTVPRNFTDALVAIVNSQRSSKRKW